MPCVRDGVPVRSPVQPDHGRRTRGPGRGAGRLVAGEAWGGRVREDGFGGAAFQATAGGGGGAGEGARLNIDAFAGSDAKIVVNAAGCGAHLKDYGEVLAADPLWAD